jgi:hypothetical protein
MSLLHRDEPPKAEVNEALAVEGHGLGRHLRVNVPQNPSHYHPVFVAVAHGGKVRMFYGLLPHSF